MKLLIAATVLFAALAAGPGRAGALDDRLRTDTGQVGGPFRRTALAALSGDGRAEQAVGNAYEWGQGVKLDPAVALEWYRRAAGHGDAKAMVDLGIMMQAGQAGPVDRPGAVLLFQRAALAGEANGSVRLAMAYEWGHGVALDPCEAAARYKAAETQGSAMAPLYRHLLAQHSDITVCALPVS